MAKVIKSPGVNMDGLLQDIRLTLADFVAFLNEDIYITSGYRQGDQGQHGKGLAVDIVVPAYADRLLDLYLAAERFAGFNGIGVYPYFQFNGKVVGGLHLDARQGKPARWMGIGRGDGNQYIALNKENLKLHGVI
jgi:uncharacterized protein YcbK (DUF882 family)